MKILRDFKCTNCGALFEHWDQGMPVNCIQCENPAVAVISGVNFSLPGHDLDFPTAAAKWARRHRQANRAQLENLGLPT